MKIIAEIYACQCHLLITFANSLDPEQAQQFMRARSGSKLFDTDGIPEEKKILKKLILKKNQVTTKKHVKLPSMQRIKIKFLPPLVYMML